MIKRSTSSRPLCLFVLFLVVPVFGMDRPFLARTNTSNDVVRPSVWQTHESPSFSIHYLAGDERLARKVVDTAERTRTELYRSWFAEQSVADWTPKCLIYLHTNSHSFATATEGRATSAGYSTSLVQGGRIVNQRIDLLRDGSNLMSAVLPHELAHVLLAHRFARRPLPLWAEEGLAVHAESPEMKEAHLKQFQKCSKMGMLYPAQELMAMRDYPDDELRGTFYAQSVALVDFLMRRRGAAPFMEFLTVAGRHGSEIGLRRVYGLTGYHELDQNWKSTSATSAKVTFAH